MGFCLPSIHKGYLFISTQQNCSFKQFPPPVTGAAALEPIITTHCIKLQESMHCVESEHYVKHDYQNKTSIFLLLHCTAQKRVHLTTHVLPSTATGVTS